MENRTYQPENAWYKFISSEQDKDIESGYTHFGFRKYDGRVARFMATEPIPASSHGWSSYVYSGNNPLIIIDPTGTEWYYNNETKDWEYYENTPWKEMGSGKYDVQGNKIMTNVQGLKELLYFSGEALKWSKESGEVESWKAVSGEPSEEGKTQPELQKVKDKGPIPEGTYTVSPEETKSYWTETNPTQIPVWVKKFTSWGFAYTPIKPSGETETYGRSGFFIHGGLSYGSIGCIDLTSPSSEIFHVEFMEHNKSMILNVNYSNFK